MGFRDLEPRQAVQYLTLICLDPLQKFSVHMHGSESSEIYHTDYTLLLRNQQSYIHHVMELSIVLSLLAVDYGTFSHCFSNS